MAGVVGDVVGGALVVVEGGAATTVLLGMGSTVTVDTDGATGIDVACTAGAGVVIAAKTPPETDGADVVAGLGAALVGTTTAAEAAVVAPVLPKLLEVVPVRSSTVAELHELVPENQPVSRLAMSDA